MVVYDWNKSNLTIMYCYSSLNADLVFDTIVCRYTLHRVFILYLALPVSHFKTLPFFSVHAASPIPICPPPNSRGTHHCSDRATLVIAKDTQL